MSDTCICNIANDREGSEFCQHLVADECFQHNCICCIEDGVHAKYEITFADNEQSAEKK